MEQNVKILAFAGSTRSGSYNKKLIKTAVRGAESTGAEVTLIDLRDFPLPLFDGDLEREQGLPENGRKLKDLFLANQGLLISSPEYNSSVTGVLKNTIDWVSRPAKGEPELNCFEGKTAALMSASTGRLGGLRGLVTLRSILENIRVLVLPGQVAVPAANEAFDENNELKDEKQRKSVENLGIKLAHTIAKLRS